MRRCILRGIALTMLSMIFGLLASVDAASLAEKLKGRIVLQIEKNGEAWYIRPDTQNRVYMGRPSDAFQLMRSVGLGISNDDLKKVSVGILPGELGGRDADDDGIHDELEQLLGYDWRNSDTDADGSADLEELTNGLDPSRANMKLPIDVKFTKKLHGKILLQVESNGEAWYVNPEDSKRYYLGRPSDAFFIMRSLGLGIKNLDLLKIPEGSMPAERVLLRKDSSAISGSSFYTNKEYGFEFKFPSNRNVLVEKFESVGQTGQAFEVKVPGGKSYGADATGTLVTVMHLNALKKSNYTRSGDTLLEKGVSDQMGFYYLDENAVYYFGTESIQDSAGFPEWIIDGYKQVGEKATLGFRAIE